MRSGWEGARWHWGDATPWDLAAGVPCGLGGRGPLPQGAGWLWWEQTVFTPSPHTLPTLGLFPGPLPSRALCAICTFAAFAQKVPSLLGKAPMGIGNAQHSPQESPSAQVPPPSRTPLQEARTAQVPSPQSTDSHHIGQGMIF